MGEPEQWWSKASGTGQLLKRDEVVEHAKSIVALEKLLKQPGRITKQRVEDFQSQYIAAHAGELIFTKNVAGGLLPGIYLVPAGSDLSDEVKVKSTTSFGRIVQRALQERHRKVRFTSS